jgi:acyl-CoA synthetase (AMP-forming)/AMP-acid ligase II
MPLCLRLVLLGGEAIAWETLTDAISTFGARGLTLASLTPAYGLAEATLAVTSDAPEEEPAYVNIAGGSIAEGAVQEVDADDPEAQRCVCVGSPLPGVGIRLDDANREIIVSSDSLASRYFGDAELTRRRFRDGELYTGDHGFERDRGLFVTGREDDLLVIAGRNVHAGAVEQRIGQDPAVRSGNCAIVRETAVRRPQTVLVAEAGVVHDARALAARLHQTAMEQAGLPIHRFVFLAPGTFPKTPSGKVQRHRCRELIADESVGTRISLSRLV